MPEDVGGLQWQVLEGGLQLDGRGALLCVAAPVCRAQSGGVLCSDGSGHFAAKFATGVSVQVGAVQTGGFADRSCDAVLIWRRRRTVAVRSAALVDIDVMGARLGLGEPVVAFESWKTRDSWLGTYEIYFLRRKPRLLKTITGGDVYRAIDEDMNRRVAIWTTDAAAVNGLDGLTYADYDAPPTMVLAFEHGRLADVSAWYRKQYNRQIVRRGDGGGSGMGDGAERGEALEVYTGTAGREARGVSNELSGDAVRVKEPRGIVQAARPFRAKIPSAGGPRRGCIRRRHWR